MSVIEKHFSNQLYIVRLLVEEADDGARLDQFLMGHLSTFSREEVKRRIAANDIAVEGRDHKLKSSTRVRMDDIVKITIPRVTQEDEYWRGEKIKLIETPDILYEDRDLIVISKPAYMATHPTGKHIFNCATVYFESIHKHTVHSVHRIDRETSGVLCLAKNPQTAQFMTDLFERDKVSKGYFFIAKKNRELSTERFEARERLGPMEEGLKRIHIHAFPEDSELGKQARTVFKILYQDATYALGLAFPQTGRQHQIRVHAMTHGFPLVGDKIYLGSFKMFQRFKDGFATEEDHDLMELPRHALHAIALQCPYKGPSTLFQDSLPPDFIHWMEQKMPELKLADLKQMIKGEVENYFSKLAN